MTILKRARTVLEILTEKDTAKILSNLTHPKTVKNISEECEIPIASAYRKINLLHKIGLITKTGNISGGIRRRLYNGYNIQEKK